MPRKSKLLDLRHEMQPARKRTRVRQGATVMRDPSDIVGVTLHQTAVVFGARPSHNKRAGQDEGLAIAYRVAQDVPAHAVSLGRFDTVVLPMPLRAYAHHAGLLNKPTLGLEIEGCYPGLVDDPETAKNEAKRSFWGDMSKRTPWTAQDQDTAEFALQTLVHLAWEENMPVWCLFAHRQSSASRRSDPGEEIFKGLLPFAKKLGLTPMMSAKWGKGRAIPEQWGNQGPY